MAGFFGLFDYTKPGKGVEADKPKKHPFFLFWELVWRKLGRLITLNLMYFIVILPLIAVAYLMMYEQILTFFPAFAEEEGFFSLLPSLLFSATSVLLETSPWLAYLLVAASVVLYGPATCGLTYVLRNYAQEEHAWISDFWDRTKKNFRQGFFLGLVDIVVVSLLVYNITFSFGALSETPMMSVIQTLSLVLLALYFFMRHYTYLMAVTFELSIFGILKNAWIFSVVAFWKNVLVTAVILLLLLVIFLTHPLVEFALLPLIFFSFCGFLAVFICYPVLQRHMIDGPSAQEEEKEALPEEEQVQ